MKIKASAIDGVKNLFSNTQYRLLKKTNLLCIPVLSIFAISASSVVLADTVTSNFSAQKYRSAYYYKWRSTQSVRGVPVTGPNQFCGQQRWSFEDQGVEPLRFRQVAAYAPGEQFPTALTQENCNSDVILASTHDPKLSFDPPGPPPSITTAPDPRLENVPLRDVPKNAGILQGGTQGIRNFIEPATDFPVNPFPVVQAIDNDPITLGQWASATGRLTFRCRDDGSAKVRIRMRNLIPNGVYSVWGVWKTPLPNGIFVDLPVPFGGVPNAIVPDRNGRAVYVRELAFCPSDVTSDESQLLWVTAAYHSDGNLYGGVPDAANVTPTFISREGESFKSPLSLMVHHEHLVFPINFTRDLFHY